MTDAKGATPADWFHFEFVLGLGGNLLPCVPASPDVKVVKGSALEGKVGKIPSMFNRAGEAHGLTEWQKRPILSNEVQHWSQDPRLNICVRTGPISGVYAIDVDVDDEKLSPAIGEIITAFLGAHAYRGRMGPSRKFLVPFKLEDGACKKRKIKLDNTTRGPAIELLADGQQFVAAGSHSSGVRYQWLPELPSSLPTIRLEQLNQMWQALTSRFATESSHNTSTTSTSPSQLSTPNSNSMSSSEGTVTPSNQSADKSQSVWTEISEPDWSQLLAALRFMLDKVKDNDSWSEIGYALLSLQGSRPAERLWYDFSKKAVGYEAGAPESWWQAHKHQTPRSDYRHIFTLAREQGWGRSSDPAVFQPVTHNGVVGKDGSEGDCSNDQVPDGSGAETEDIDVTPPLLPEKPFVRLGSNNFSEIVDQLERIIEPYVYTQGSQLTRPSEAHTVREIRRSSDALMLTPATKAWARKRFGELAVFQRWAPKKEDWYSVDPSAEHINTLLELGNWTTLRPLDAIARAPFVRDDGSICDTPGYDPRSRALYVPAVDFPGIPLQPSASDASNALGRLRGVFDQFPWKVPASESAFLAHILSEAGRLAIDKCPMFWYSAPSAGTGKSMLCEMASTIVHGTVPAVRPWVSDGVELRKTLFSSLLAGDRSIAFDNVPDGHKIRTPELCAFITSTTWQDRKLGVSESPRVPNRAVVSATGNNVTPVRDMARRSIVIRLDANTERLKERRFKIVDLPSHVMANRPQMLVDALTIIKAYTPVDGMPVPLPSFERWSRVAREPLMWLGMPDPCETQDETDDETGNLQGVFSKFVAHFGEREFTGMDVARLVGGLADANGELNQALIQSGCSEPNSPLKIGYWLRGERDKISAGWKLTHAGAVKTGVKWKMVRVEESLT